MSLDERTATGAVIMTMSGFGRLLGMKNLLNQQNKDFRNIWWGCCTGGRKGVYPMNNAAMSGTHYPLDKEPRGRNEDDDSLRGRRRKVKISSKAMDSVSS